MTARSAQLLAAGLGFVLILLLGAVLFIVLSRPPQGPQVSPSPSAVAVVSPSLPVFPSFSFSPFPTISQLPTSSPSAPPVTLPPSPTLPPTPSPTPSPPPTPTAPPVPTAAARQLRIVGLGLDPRNLTGGVERFVIFTTDGPSIVRVQISEATARSRVCLWQGIDVGNRQCDTIRNGVLEWPVFGEGAVAWTLSLIGASETAAPTVNVTLDFNANAPSVEVQNLLFNGPSAPAYNGLMWSVDTLGEGTLGVMGTFQPTQQQSYRVVILEAGVGEVRNETADDVESFSIAHEVTAETSYLVSVTNPNEHEGLTPLFLNLSTSWP